MFGFLFKIILMAAVVAGGGYAYLNKDKLPDFTSQFKAPTAINFDASSAGKRISDTLDALVTHPDQNSPVILGMKITNDSLSQLVDFIQSLPPGQVSELKQILCAPPDLNTTP